MSEQLSLFELLEDEKFKAICDLIDKLHEDGDETLHETYVPQNTGYTNGVTWFDSGSLFQSFDTEEAAINYNNKLKEELNSDEIKFRVIKRIVKEIVVHK